MYKNVCFLYQIIEKTDLCTFWLGFAGMKGLGSLDGESKISRMLWPRDSTRLSKSTRNMMNLHTEGNIRMNKKGKRSVTCSHCHWWTCRSCNTAKRTRVWARVCMCEMFIKNQAEVNFVFISFHFFLNEWQLVTHSSWDTPQHPECSVFSNPAWEHHGFLCCSYCGDVWQPHATPLFSVSSLLPEFTLLWLDNLSR